IAFTLAGVTRRFGVTPDDAPGFGNADGAQGQLDGALDGFPYDEYFQIDADNSLDYGTADTIRFPDEHIVLAGAGIGLNFLPRPDLTTLPSLTPPPGGFFGGSLRLLSYSNDIATGDQVTDENASAGLLITSITTGGVPEPAGWTLLIAG